MGEADSNVFHKRTMIAHEDHEEGFGVREIGERNHFPGGVGKAEIGSGGAQGQHGGIGGGHGRNLERLGTRV